MAGKADHYDVLGIDRGASPDQVKRAYRKLALSWHPDKNPNNRAEATEVFRMVTEAYEVLGDPDKRRAYDTYGHHGAAAAQSDARGSGSGSGSGGVWHQGSPFPSGMRDPFEMFDSFFGSARNGAFGARSSMNDLFKHTMFGGSMFGGRAPEGGGGLRGFFDDPFFQDDFFRKGNDGFGDFMGMQGEAEGGGSRGFTSYSSSSTTVGPDGVPRTVSRTERTVVNPDGTRETKVEEFVDGQPVAPGTSLTDDPRTNQGWGQEEYAVAPRRRSSGKNVTRLFGGGRPR